jgi:hypothetical protein
MFYALSLRTYLHVAAFGVFGVFSAGHTELHAFFVLVLFWHFLTGGQFCPFLTGGQFSGFL